MENTLSVWPRNFALLFGLALLSACASTSPERTEQRLAWTDQVQWPELSPPEAGQLLEVVESDVRIVVLPAGRLARFGHPHVIGGDVISGRVLLTEDPIESWVDLAIDVGQLVVDRPDWRAAEGFDPALEQQAIDDTRANLMSEAVLHVDEFPRILLRGIELSGPAWAADLQAYVQIRDQVRSRRLPVRWSRTERGLSASGSFTLRQSEFGLTPFSALSGALSVTDELTVRFRVVAEPR